jgi:hypothetical protein
MISQTFPPLIHLAASYFALYRVRPLAHSDARHRPMSETHAFEPQILSVFQYVLFQDRHARHFNGGRGMTSKIASR